MVATGPSARPARYVHDALFYDGVDDLVAVAAPFLLDGLAAGDAAVVAAGADTAAVLCEAVGNDPRVHVLPRSDVYRPRTPAVITTFRRLADQQVAEGARRVRVVGETDFGATPRDWVEWQRYEAVINDALAPWPLWGLCVFDTRRLPDEVVEAGRRTHPHVVSPGGRRANAAFTEPGAYLRALPVPHEPLEATPPRLAATGITDFIGLRHAVACALAGLDGDRDATEDFLLAVDEMTSNALRHGRPPVDLRLWASGGRVVCSITDHGDGPTDPFAGYGPAHGTDLSRGGMGLWLARQLCDHVDIWSGEGRVTVRLTSRLR
ncbi:anti-sigma factor RsbA family regulatory protein [Geodermatophilus sp. SYSU D00742]